MITDETPLDDLLVRALERLQIELNQAAPFLAGQVSDWMLVLAQSARPEAYFQNPVGFPLLRLPWWLERSLPPAEARDDPSRRAFHADVVYSTVNGYYYIRLLDNVMDGHPVLSGASAAGERQLLPAAAFFHTQFQSAYQRSFEAAHPFWEHFRRTWFHAADVTARDAGLAEVDLEAFRCYAGQKVCAVKIPLAAVCYWNDRLDLLEPWSRLVDALGVWHQMWNDVFDWSKDLRHGTRTYFLSEAEQRRRPDEAAAAWIVREGFAWGVATLHAWLAEVEAVARPLNSRGLTAYLRRRRVLLLQQQAEVAAGLRGLASLAAAMA